MHAAIAAIVLSLTVSQSAPGTKELLARCPAAREQLVLLGVGTYTPEENIKAFAGELKRCKISWKQLNLDNEKVYLIAHNAIVKAARRSYELLLRGSEYYYAFREDIQKAMYTTDPKTGETVRRFTLEDLGGSEKEYRNAIHRGCLAAMEVRLSAFYDEGARRFAGLDTLVSDVRREQARGGCSPEEVTASSELAKLGVSP